MLFNDYLLAVYVYEKLHSVKFFDDEVQTSMFFVTLHDAMLHILEKHPDTSKAENVSEKVKNNKKATTQTHAHKPFLIFHSFEYNTFN